MSFKMPGGGAELRQNNDPKHSAKLTTEFLCKNRVRSDKKAKHVPQFESAVTPLESPNLKIFDVRNPSNKNQLK